MCIFIQNVIKNCIEISLFHQRLQPKKNNRGWAMVHPHTFVWGMGGGPTWRVMWFPEPGDTNRSDTTVGSSKLLSCYSSAGSNQWSKGDIEVPLLRLFDVIGWVKEKYGRLILMSMINQSNKRWRLFPRLHLWASSAPEVFVGVPSGSFSCTTFLLTKNCPECFSFRCRDWWYP